MRPYIGITDFTSAEQVQRIHEVPQKRVIDNKNDHQLGVGVMMSYKTLHGLPTKWTDVFPPKEQLAEIFIEKEDTFNILHYADYDGVTTKDDLREAIRFGGPYLHALQLDMVWPSVDLVLTGLRNNEHLRVILQVGELAMKSAGDSPESVVALLQKYRDAGCIHYVLLDRSMGRGKGLDAELLLTYYHAIRERFHRDELGIVIAGGLGPETMNLLALFRYNYMLELSIDAQGQLRRSGNALDPIDWDRAEEYYAEACRFFGWL